MEKKKVRATRTNGRKDSIESGMEAKTLQKILGHNSLQMTMDLYCHVRESTLTDEMERIANFM